MLVQARAELPNECCGFLAGGFEGEGKNRVGRATRILPLINELASPVEYQAESKSLFRAHREMDQAGLEVLATYHSHPTSAPIPSKKDMAMTYGEEVMSLIISMLKDPLEIRAWWLTETAYREATLVVTD